ncbi:hypothetical protein B4U84_28735 [Westiellopsis prolifica IICB1]|nr:hypothetical protein B4U84_28735 [Westiellopsis prolifica IICB1]
MIYKKVTELIGHQKKLLQLPLKKHFKSEVLLKLEKFNPGGSMKDRMALSMLLDAQKRGLIKGGTIYCSSSGNTVAGLAIVCAECGYNLTAVVDHHASKQKLDFIRVFGAKTHFVNSSDLGEDQVATALREKTEIELAAFDPRGFALCQYDNPSNPMGYTSLGKDLLDATEGRIDVLVASVGTGGSVTGVVSVLKKNLPNLLVIGVEPKGSTAFEPRFAHPYYQSGTGTPGGVKPAKNINYDLIDRGLKVSDKEAFAICRYLARNYGLLIGGSSGGIIYKALELATQSEQSLRILVLVPDGGEKYLNTIYNDQWMCERNLLAPEIENHLAEILEKKTWDYVSKVPQVRNISLV